MMHTFSRTLAVRITHVQKASHIIIVCGNR